VKAKPTAYSMPLAAGRWVAARARLRPRAFTLLEVILAMGLLMIVVGGVYGIANGAIGLGRAMSDSRVHETRVMNLVSAWRDFWAG
jgi:hypothetical protein